MKTCEARVDHSLDWGLLQEKIHSKHNTTLFAVGPVIPGTISPNYSVFLREVRSYHRKKHVSEGFAHEYGSFLVHDHLRRSSGMSKVPRLTPAKLFLVSGFSIATFNHS